VAIGASDFASSFAGDISKVELPEQGARLRQGERAWTLVASENRRLTQTMPIEGEVVEVNRELANDPLLAQRHPYGAGWILRIRPVRLRENLQNLLPDGLTDFWRGATLTKVNALLRPELGALANDGGEWVAGFGGSLSDEDWEAIRRELFPIAEDHDTFS
jgi:glycine cleavage system H protein